MTKSVLETCIKHATLALDELLAEEEHHGSDLSTIFRRHFLDEVANTNVPVTLQHRGEQSLADWLKGQAEYTKELLTDAVYDEVDSELQRLEDTLTL